MKVHLSGLVLALILLLAFSAQAKAKDIPDMKDSSLEIPWSDFKGILEKLIIEEPEPEPEEEKEPDPPAPFVITSADYEGKVETDDDGAAFDFTIKFTVLDKKEWQLIEFLPSDLAIDELKLDKKPALLINDDGWHSVAIKSPGEHTLTGKFYVQAENSLGPHSISFSVLETPVTTLSFSIMQPDLTIQAEPANMNKVTNKSGTSMLSAVLPSTDNINISWSRKVDVEKAELRLNAEVESLVSLGERLCRVESVVRYEILHRGVTEFKLVLPPDASVVDIIGTGVADWKVAETEGKNLLTVKLNYEAKGSYNLQINYEKSLPDATAEADVPVLEVLGVSREVGYLGVAARTNIEVGVNKLENLASVDISRLPGGVINRSIDPLIFGFKYIGHPWSLQLQATKHKDVEVLTCTVDKVSIHSFLTDEGEFLTHAVYTVRNNREQFIRIKLPAGSKVFNAFRAGKPVQPAKDNQGRILIPLEKSTGNSGQPRAFTIEITYLAGLGELSRFYGNFTLQAPESDIMTNDLTWTIYLPDEYGYKVKETTMKELEFRGISGRTGDRSQSKPDNRLSALGYVGGNEELGISNLEKKKTGTASVYGNNVQLDSYDGNSDFRGGGNAPKAQIDKQGFVRGALPVRFIVPSEGISLQFTKTLIQQGGGNTATITYRKTLDLDPYTKRNAVKTLVTVIVILVLLGLFRRRRNRRKARAGETE